MAPKRAIFSLFACVFAAAATPPAPREVLGFSPGDDYKIASYEQIIDYFRRLEHATDRMRIVEIGKTSEGRSMMAAFFSSPENLRRLGEYQSISHQLAKGEAPPDQARQLAARGKAIVWIDSSIHATEVAPAQHSLELAYRIVTGESEEMRRIRDNVILLDVPVANPDGLDMVADWYRRNIGTRYETAPLPWLYQKYAGHDNNRDWFMLNLPETRHMTRLLFQEWFPQIVYDQHQAPPSPARIFVPPYGEPLNPNIPAAVMEGINSIGSAIKERMAREGMSGALSYWGFDAWWNGGLRSVPAFHNMHGILTETALNSYATPRTYSAKDFPERFGNGIPTRQPSVFYERPWTGGRWGTKEAIDYMLNADMAILNLAATNRADYLLKSWQMARAAIDAGSGPYAYVIPPPEAGWQCMSVAVMLERLSLAGVRVEQALEPFRADGKQYPETAYVLRAAQPFRPYLLDLMEPQKYPEIKTGANGPTKRPYDIAGWTLPMEMGVTVDRINAEFAAKLRTVDTFPDAKPLVEGPRRARVAIYQAWLPNTDEGWTEWLLDEFSFRFTRLHNDGMREGNLREKFDAIILPSQSAKSILQGTRSGERWPSREDEEMETIIQRPEYSGGIGPAGLRAIELFVSQGGELIAFGEATDLPVEDFPLPVRNVTRGHSEFFCPGSLLRIHVDTTTGEGKGMPSDACAFESGTGAFESTLADDSTETVRPVAKYSTSNILASGWLSGEKMIAGKDAVEEVRYGKGRVILFAIRPQFRGQMFGTFRLVLNSIQTTE